MASTKVSLTSSQTASYNAAAKKLGYKTLSDTPSTTSTSTATKSSGGSGGSTPPTYSPQTGHLTDYGVSIGAKAVQPGDPRGAVSTKEQKIPTKVQPQVQPVGQPQIEAPVQAETPYTIQSGDTLSKIAQQSGQSIAQIMAANPQITDPNKIVAGQQLNRFKQGFQQTVAGGAVAPTTMGAATQEIQSMVPQEEQDMTAIDLALEENKGWQEMTKTYEDIYNPENQKASLMDTYNKLYKKSGLAELDEEIIDAATIIDGTEDDIRNEVEQAGGFGTDSQVQALALSRNKVLLKNYNNLVALRETKQNNLNTMMSLAQQDRAYADAQFDRMVNYQSQLINYREKFIQNARDQYNKYEPAQLYAMLQDNPRQLAFAEQIMGIGTGGLQKASTYVAPLSEMDKLDMKYKKAQIDKIYSDMNDGGGSGDSELSSTTQAIINNPSLFDDLTPTKKGEVITELTSHGYDTSNLGNKGLSDTAIKEISQTQKALDDLDVLKSKMAGNEEFIGPIKGLQKLNPWSKARQIQSDVDRVRQTVGKALEGGVLRKEDEEKYKKILATLTDTPETAVYKIDALKDTITRDIENYKLLQQGAGRSMNVNTSLQKKGSTINTEDLRAKYNY